jgi:hypothetical protein
MQSVKLEPIYLTDVADNPQPSPYKDMIQSCKTAARNTGKSGTSSPSVPKQPRTWRASLRALCASGRPSVRDCVN